MLPVLLTTVIALSFVTMPQEAAPRPDHGARAAGLPEVSTHDNRTPAGTIADGTLSLRLRAAVGAWRPEGESGRSIRIEAFGEAGQALSIPAPLIRVRAGTRIDLTIHNELSHPLRVHGFCERGAANCAPLEVPSGETRGTRFTSGPAGTYTYWATTTGMPQPFRASDDTQLSGAFVVDPADGPAEQDRIFVITDWTSVTRSQLKELVALDDPNAAFIKLRPDVFAAINGRIWPHTERLRYKVSDRVRWRVINLSTQVHPMHLHGFYFEVDSLGDGATDRAFSLAEKPRVVTQLMPAGSTMTMTWVPEREGNWLFHCHVMTHVSPSLFVDRSPKSPGHQSHHAEDAGGGMTGMVLGITVDGPESPESWPAGSAKPRALTLVMQSEPKRFGDAPAMGFKLESAAAAEAGGGVRVPGPTLVLTRDEPVEITLINRLGEGTAIHWHGMELESFYDGVHGWGRTGQRTTPMIEPGESFVVRFTPPRTGTFMYHTHLHDNIQLTSGLYGAMIVVEPGERFDEQTDHVLVLGRGGPQLDAPLVINDSREPQFAWKAGAKHRLRLINITPDDIVTVALQTGEGPVTWMPLTKDGAPVPSSRRVGGPARQLIGVGETYDFEFEAPPGRRTLWLEVRSAGGRWLTQARIILK